MRNREPSPVTWSATVGRSGNVVEKVVSVENDPHNHVGNTTIIDDQLTEILAFVKGGSS